MSAIVHQRCFNHDFREAACRCPLCARYYCRECVTEHEDRVVCAQCLRTLAAQRDSAARRSLRRMLRGALRRALRYALPALGLLLAWGSFYAAGRMLLLIPAEVHDGTVWESK